MRGIGLLLCLLPLVWGCRSVSEMHMDADLHPSVSLDANYIERCALLNQWQSVRRHLMQVEASSLPDNEKSLALYWMGMAQYHLGNRQAASTNWTRALSYEAPLSLKGKIQKAKGALQSYELSEATVSDLDVLSGHGEVTSGAWALQYGAFRLRKSAEDMAKDLAWKGLNLHITRVQHVDGRELWTVWSGPYGGTEVRQKQQSLSHREVPSLVKPSRLFNL